MSTTAVRRITRRPPPLLGALLRFGWLRVRGRMADAVRADGFRDLQDAHLSVFQYPGPDGLRPSDIARQGRMSRQAINHLLGQLEAWGYIVRRAASADERRLVHLTPRGRAVIRTIQRSVREFERNLAGQVGGGRFSTFLDVLEVCAAPAVNARGAAARVRQAAPPPGRRPRRSSPG